LAGKVVKEMKEKQLGVDGSKPCRSSKTINIALLSGSDRLFFQDSGEFAVKLGEVSVAIRTSLDRLSQVENITVSCMGNISFDFEQCKEICINESSRIRDADLLVAIYDYNSVELTWAVISRLEVPSKPVLICVTPQFNELVFLESFVQVRQSRTIPGQIGLIRVQNTGEIINEILDWVRRKKSQHLVMAH
jgi:hypothetical protein